MRMSWGQDQGGRVRRPRRRRVLAALTFIVGSATMGQWVSPVRVHATMTLAPTVAPSMYATTVEGDHPVAYWRLDETSGTTAHDATGNGHDGTINGGVTLGQPGATNDGDTAMSFDGSSGDITVSNLTGIPSGNQSYTLEAWVKGLNGANNMGSPDGFIGYGNYGTDGQVIAFRDAGCNGLDTYWWNYDTSANFSANLCDGSYHYIVATYDNATGTRTIYLDGVQVGQDQAPTTNNAQLMNFALAKTNGGEYLQGALDDVAIYDYALSQTQITNHYNAVVAPPPTDTPTDTATNTPTDTATRTPSATPTVPVVSVIDRPDATGHLIYTEGIPSLPFPGFFGNANVVVYYSMSPTMSDAHIVPTCLDGHGGMMPCNIPLSFGWTSFQIDGAALAHQIIPACATSVRCTGTVYFQGIMKATSLPCTTVGSGCSPIEAHTYDSTGLVDTPTATAPPTDTASPTSTATATNTPTDTATATPVPATNTPTRSATTVPVNTATDTTAPTTTAVPPVSTATTAPVNTATDTAVPPAATVPTAPVIPRSTPETRQVYTPPFALDAHAIRPATGGAATDATTLERVTVRLGTSPHAAVTLRLTFTHGDVTTGRRNGRHHVHGWGYQTLYATIVRLKADGSGRVQRTLTVAYAPARPIVGQVILSAQTPQGTLSRGWTVKLTPASHTHT